MSTTFTQCAPETTKLGKITQKGPFRRSTSFKVTDFGTNRKLIYDFLLVINTNLRPILQCFGVIAFDMSEIAIFRYPLAFKPPRGSPGTISVKFSVNVNGWPQYQTAKKSRVHERHRQTTDGRTIAYSEREREFAFAKNGVV